MAQENFNVSLPNDGLGDELRAAFIKQQNMNTELYSTKVDKVTGKDLSDNNYDNAAVNKLASLDVNAEQNVQSDWNELDPTSDSFILGKPIFESGNIDVSAIWTGTGFIFDVEANAFPIGGVIYPANPNPALTLDGSDGTLDRIDLIVAIKPVDPATVGEVGIIKGTLATTALVVPPDYDPATYYVIKQVIVRAASSIPEDTAKTTIYDEGDPSDWGLTLSANLAVTATDPSVGNTCIEGTNVDSNDAAHFINPTPESTETIGTISFDFKQKEAVSGRVFIIEIRNAGVLIKQHNFFTGENGWDEDNLSYQNINIDKSKLNLPIQDWDELRIRPFWGGLGYFIDNVVLNTGSGSETVPESGIPEAPVDGNVYGRKNAAWFLIPSGLGDVTAANVLGDNALMRGDGGGKGIQTSVVTVDDLGNMLGIKEATVNDLPVFKTLGDLLTTGIECGGLLSPNVDTTKFDISDGFGFVVDNFTDPDNPIVTRVDWTGLTAIVPTYIATTNISFVALDSAGLVVQQNTDFTEEQLRDLIVLGVLIHTNNVDVTGTADNSHGISSSYLSSDIGIALGDLNMSGNNLTPAATDLTVRKEAGRSFRPNSNRATNVKDPNFITSGVLNPLTFLYVYDDGAGGITVVPSQTDLDPSQYDDGSGTLDSVANNGYTNQWFYFLVESGTVVVRYGEELFTSLALAEAAALRDYPSIIGTGLDSESIRTVITLKGNATDLTDVSEAVFTDTGKFGLTGGVGGGGGGGTAQDLQDTYNNSTTPEITTDGTRGALTVKGGTGTDTDSVFEGKNNAGTTTFEVDGNGTAESQSSVALLDAKGVQALPNIAWYNAKLPDSIGLAEVKDLFKKVLTNATVTGTQNLDWSLYSGFIFTMTGATTFADLNLPAAPNETQISFLMTGDFAYIPPTYWKFGGDDYDGTGWNLFTLECKDDTGAAEQVICIISNLT